MPSLSESSNAAHTPGGRARGGIGLGLLLAGLFACAAAPFILTGFDHGRGAFDDINYHAKVIAAFARDWPRPDFGDYLSMTTPGYHVVLAAAAVALGDSRELLQSVGMLFTLGLLALLGTGAARRAGDAASGVELFAVCLPLACSLYVFNAGVWLLPDNAAWLGVLGVLLIALRGRVDAWTYLGGGVVLTALVFVRQVHLWAAAPLWVAAWLGTMNATRPARALGEPTFGASLRRVVVSVVCTLPAFILVAYFVNRWGGLCPPTFTNWVKPPGRSALQSPAAGAFILGLIGVASCFFIAHLVPGLARLWRHARWVLALAGLAGLLVGVLPPTSFSPPDGRYSGLWAVARPFTIADRSPAIGLLSCLGAVMLAGWCASVSLRDRLILLAALAGFGATQMVNPWVWQRYIEPLVLVVMVLFATGAAAESARARFSDLAPHWRVRLRVLGIAGPCVLAGVLAASTVYALATSPGKVPDLGFMPGPPGVGFVQDPPMHGRSERQILKPGVANPDK